MLRDLLQSLEPLSNLFSVDSERDHRKFGDEIMVTLKVDEFPTETTTTLLM